MPNLYKDLLLVLMVSFPLLSPKDACHSFEIILGNDLCICTIWQLCGMWWIGQHLLDIQPEDKRGQCTSEPRTPRPHRLVAFCFFCFFLVFLHFCFRFLICIDNMVLIDPNSTIQFLVLIIFVCLVFQCVPRGQ